MTPEGKVKKEIKSVLRAHGILPTPEAAAASSPTNWVYMPVHTGYGEAGVPDFVCCIDGHFVGIEAKSETGKQTPRQRLVEKAVLNSGGTYVVIRSGEEMERFLNNIGR